MGHGPAAGHGASAAAPARPATGERYVALVGPTASGKSAAALAIAERHPVEIVSVDSAQVYRGLDIGTAKPSVAERAALPHHLIDIRDPATPYSAAEFAADARQLIREINARGRLALLVGGTLLYLRALRSGLDALPPADARVRAELEQRALQLGWPALHAELARVDPPAAARIAPRDAQRIQRALEVWYVCGQPISSLFASEKIVESADEACVNPVFSLEPIDRGWLHDRIARRFDQMLDEGLLDEVGALHARGDLDAGLPALRSVGYRQAWAVLDGRLPLCELRERGIFATRQLAKRQLTWLRSMRERQVIAADAPDALPRLLAAVDATLGRNASPGESESG